MFNVHKRPYLFLQDLFEYKNAKKEDGFENEKKSQQCIMDSEDC